MTNEEPLVEEIETENGGILENLSAEEVVALGLATGVICGIVVGSLVL